MWDSTLQLTENEWKLLLLLFRPTYGYNKIPGMHMYARFCSILNISCSSWGPHTQVPLVPKYGTSGPSEFEGPELRDYRLAALPSVGLKQFRFWHSELLISKWTPFNWLKSNANVLVEHCTHTGIKCTYHARTGIKCTYHAEIIERIFENVNLYINEF